MFPFVKAIVATLLIAEIAGAFALSFITLVLFTLHLHGVIFWGVEAVTAAFVLYACLLFFKSALKYETAEARQRAD